MGTVGHDQWGNDMEIYTLITILLIYIIGVIVAYGLMLGTIQSGWRDNELATYNYKNDRLLVVGMSLMSWPGCLVPIFAVATFAKNQTLCFQWRRKG